MPKRMAVIINQVSISSTPEAVYDYCIDMRNELEWNPNVKAIEKLTEGPVGAGTKFRAKWKPSGEAIVECTHSDRPRRWRCVSKGPLSVIFDGSVEPTAGGAILKVRFDAKPSGMMRLFFPVMKRILRRQERANMQRIKLALESKSD